MPSVAIVTDTTHYLPRALADSQGIHQVSLYVGWGDEREREIELASFDEFYRRLAADRELPTTSQPSIGDFLAVWEPLLEAGLGHRLDASRGRHLGNLRGRPPGARPARRARPGRARRGDRQRNRVRRHGHAGARGRRRRPRRRQQGRGRGARARGAQGAEDLVLHRHPRVPAPRRPCRPRAGVARWDAEDQADPLARVRDHARRARAHRGARVRAHGPVHARAARGRLRRVGRAAHPGHRAGPAPDRARARDLRLRAAVRFSRSGLSSGPTSARA